MGGGSEGVRWVSRLSRWRQPVVVAGLATLLLGLIGYLVFPVPLEPVYRGKALSVWLQTYNPASPLGPGSRAWKETDEALRHIGTNAIPFLVKMLRARDSRLKLRLVALAQQQHWVKIRFVPAAARNAEAAKAFIVLGKAAKGAVPELIKAYEETGSAEARSAIEDAFTWIGPDAQPAVPLLLRAATNSNNRVRANALWALGEIHAQPQACVPVLMAGLNDSDVWAQTSAAHALGMFGPDASAAIPALAQAADMSQVSRLLMSRSSFTQVHFEAQRALWRIEPGLLSTTNVPSLEWETSGPSSLLFSQ